MALIEELVCRGGVFVALSNRSEEELSELLQFLIWKVADHRFSSVLLEVTRITIDMYSGVFGLSSKIQQQLGELEKVISSQVQLG